MTGTQAHPTGNFNGTFLAAHGFQPAPQKMGTYVSLNAYRNTGFTQTGTPLPFTQHPVHSSSAVMLSSALCTQGFCGVASTYNPFRPGWRTGGASTSTGERYNPGELPFKQGCAAISAA
jgi:rare lipoprotein A (peptidoglycan hydrolase)